jgi:hypothetical protein
MLLAFTVRAFIPHGYMPAMNRPFSFQICPDGFPAQLLRDIGLPLHGDGASHAARCVFGMACAPGPPLQPVWPTEPARAEIGPVLRLDASIRVVRLVYLPHARGPPSNS